MAEIQVTDQYRISSDTHCWSVDKRSWKRNKDTGEREVVWVADRWYETFESAVNGLAQMLLRESPAVDIQALKTDAKRIEGRLAGLRESVDDGGAE